MEGVIFIAFAIISTSVTLGSNYVNGKQNMLVKQRIQTNIRVLMGAVLVIVLSFVFTSQSFAQTKTSAVNNAANVLKVSPVRSDIEIQPGGRKVVQVTVTNLSSTPITLKAIENDFVSGDERGTPALILDADKYAPTHSLKRFMSPIANVTVPANKAKTVEVIITVPAGTQAGGYFGAIRFAPVAPDGGGQVNLSGSVASLMLLSVPGDTVEKLNMTEFKIIQDGKSGAYFQTPNDLNATVRFQNQGNVQIGPFGKLSVKQGDTVVYETDFNNKDQRDMILPDSARRWDIPLKKIGSFGNYTVSAVFTYGKKNQTIEVSQSFWVVPQFVIFATIGAVLGLIALIVIIWLFLRSYKRRVLRSGGRGGYRR